jgi:hypothetical protein
VRRARPPFSFLLILATLNINFLFIFIVYRSPARTCRGRRRASDAKSVVPTLRPEASSRPALWPARRDRRGSEKRVRETVAGVVVKIARRACGVSSCIHVRI